MHFIIADDHPLFRGALRQVLSGQSENVEIVEVGDFDAVRKLVAERDDIDLLLLDLTMPGGAGLSGLVALKALQPALPVVIVSATDDAATIHHAVELGASGFISKSASMETIGEAVRALALYETPGRQDLRAIFLAVARQRAGLPVATGLSALGPDRAAIRPEDRGQALYDLGLRRTITRFCIRTDKAALLQAFEGLRAGHFMNKMPVDIKNRGTILDGLYHMRVPDLFE